MLVSGASSITSELTALTANENPELLIIDGNANGLTLVRLRVVRDVQLPERKPHEAQAAKADKDNGPAPVFDDRRRGQQGERGPAVQASVNEGDCARALRVRH